MTDTTKIRVGALEGFRDLVFELGEDPTAILKEVGIDEILWKTPDTLILTEQYRHTLNLAAKQTKTPRFGLLLSQRQSFHKFGAVGYLISNTPDLKTALSHLTKYVNAHDAATVANLVTDEDVALINHTLAGVGNESAIQQTELAIGLVTKFIRSSVDPEWTPDAIYFSHSRPDGIALYQRIFRCPVYFDHDLSGIEFKASDLSKPLIASDAKLYDILEKYVQQMNVGKNTDILSKARREIQNEIESGTPLLKNVAKRLNLTSAELQRRLKRQDAHFQALLEQERFGLACKLMRDTDNSLSTISAMLGYAELPVFSRAFKRIAGQSPRAWRRENYKRNELIS